MQEHRHKKSLIILHPKLKDNMKSYLLQLFLYNTLFYIEINNIYDQLVSNFTSLKTNSRTLNKWCTTMQNQTWPLSMSSLMLLLPPRLSMMKKYLKFHSLHRWESNFIHCTGKNQALLCLISRAKVHPQSFRFNRSNSSEKSHNSLVFNCLRVIFIQ